ncbi:MAG: S9 family peptidase [Gemmatimonadota bacterium]
MTRRPALSPRAPRISSAPHQHPPHAVRDRRRFLTPAAFLLLVMQGAPLHAIAAQAPTVGRALVIEDFYRLRGAGTPSLSTNGRWVAFTVTSREEATNADPSEVWLVGSDGRTPAMRVSPAGAIATAPAWSADGRLRFAVNGKGYSLDPDTPRQVTEGDAPGGRRRDGAEQRFVAPLGDVTAILRGMPPTPRQRPVLTDFEQRHEARFKGVEFDWLNFQRDGQPFPVPNEDDPEVSPPQELWIERGGNATQLTHLALRPQGVAWNRDGTRLLFTADSSYRDERRYGASAVYTVALDGTVRSVTPDREVQHTNAAFSPDGRWVLYTRQLSTDAVIAQHLDHGAATDLAIVAADGGSERILTGDWDYLPTNASWSPDGRYVYFMGGVGGTTHLFRVAPAGGAVEQVTRGERRIGNVTFDAGYTTISYTVGTNEAPSDLYAARIDGSGERRLTSLNAEFVREVALSRVERLQFPSADGTPIEGWLMYPSGYRPNAGPYPLIVSSHGGPHAADGYGFDFKSQYFAAQGYFVLKVNFRSSTGYGEKFLWATWGAWGDKDGQDVMAGLDYAIAHYPIDRTKVATIGHSYGGFMTNWLMTQYPDRFAAAIPGAGIVNWVSDYGTADIARTKETEFFGTPWDPAARERMIRQSPLTYADRARAPTLFINGEVDQRVPYSEAEQMFVALRKNGVPAKVIQYEGMPHSISGSWNQVHRMLNELRWLNQWLGGGKVS